VKETIGSRRGASVSHLMVSTLEQVPDINIHMMDALFMYIGIWDRQGNGGCWEEWTGVLQVAVSVMHFYVLS